MMVVDPDPPVKRLPFELEIRILGTTVRSSMTSSNQPMEAYVDTYFNDILHSTTFISLKQGHSSTTGSTSTGSLVPQVSGSTSSVHGTGAATTCTTTVLRPLHNLDPNLKISFIVHRNRINTSANTTSAGRVDLQLNQLIDHKNQGFIEHEYPIQNVSNRYLQLSIELREQILFTISKNNPNKRKNEIINTEIILSPRLKDKIIILSLAIESNCNGLLDEIIHFLTEAEGYITELDLYDIIDDINQMYKKSEFSKLITLLQDSDHPLKSVTPYPVNHSEWCVYTKLIALPCSEEVENDGYGNSGSNSNNSSTIAALQQQQQQQQQQNKRNSVRITTIIPNIAFQQRVEDVARSNQKFFKYQPYLSRDHMPGFMRHPPDSPEVANITPGLLGYRLTLCCIEGGYYELILGNFYEYIQLQKIFSILKFQPEEAESGSLEGCWQVLYYPSEQGEVASESVKATLSLSANSYCFQLNAQRRQDATAAVVDSSSGVVAGEAAGFDPISIAFDEVSD